MTLITRAAAAALVFGCTAVHAVPYTLPSTEARPYAQLQAADGSQLLCATWQNDGACDVDPGEYRLVTYSTDWTGQSSQITISDPTTETAQQITTVTKDCSRDEAGDGDGNQFCAASCPSGTTTIATQCFAASASEELSTLGINSGGVCLWTDSSSGFDGFSATATCLSN